MQIGFTSLRMACVLVEIIGDRILLNAADSFLEGNGLCVLTNCLAQALENHTLLLNQTLSFCLNTRKRVLKQNKGDRQPLLHLQVEAGPTWVVGWLGTTCCWST
jgi:hypothetical protein